MSTLCEESSLPLSEHELRVVTNRLGLETVGTANDLVPGVPDAELPSTKGADAMSKEFVEYTAEEIAAEEEHYTLSGVYSSKLIAMWTNRYRSSVNRSLRRQCLPGLKLGGGWVILKEDWRAFAQGEAFPGLPVDDTTIMSVEDVAVFLGISNDVTRMYFREGTIPGIKNVHGQWEITRGDLYRLFVTKERTQANAWALRSHRRGYVTDLLEGARRQ